ncbi:unnamed protein product [Adineta ricciae]|uniref:Uncharacterized protein n=1 Tax=Adineta ricciae TaxID=249248 RepID=A0A813Q9S3_ADIRI|nr:unnamed protein product [Adineta ricciae]CAF1479900.1 unnamed protein product [Adineta ricciae]
MSSITSSSGIESDTDSSPSSNEEKYSRSTSDTNTKSTDTLINDDEGFISMDLEEKKLNTMSNTPIQSCSNQPNQQCTYLASKSSYLPYFKRNPYDDDISSPSSIEEDWDEECKLTEPYYFPSYIRRAQWPNHWRWTPPLGIRRTCTQQLHRNFGFEPTGLYDDENENSPFSINRRNFTFDLR